MWTKNMQTKEVRESELNKKALASHSQDLPDKTGVWRPTKESMIVSGIAFINLFVWVFVLATTVAADVSEQKKYYNANIVILAVLCFIEAMCVFAVGLHTGLRISKELAPVYVSGGPSIDSQPGGSAVGTPATQTVDGGTTWRTYCAAAFSLMCRRKGNKLQTQHDVLRELVYVSSVIAFFFLVRSLAFVVSTYALQ